MTRKEELLKIFDSVDNKEVVKNKEKIEELLLPNESRIFPLKSG